MTLRVRPHAGTARSVGWVERGGVGFPRWGRRLTAPLLMLALLAPGVACSNDDADAAPPGVDPAVVSDPAVVHEEEGSGGTLRLALVAPDTIDPAQIVPTDPAEVITADLLFDALTAIDPETSEAVPALAERWTTNDDLTEWTFELRPDATFTASLLR